MSLLKLDRIAQVSPAKRYLTCLAVSAFILCTAGTCTYGVACDQAKKEPPAPPLYKEIPQRTFGETKVFTTTDKPEEVLAFYGEQLPSQGWESNSTTPTSSNPLVFHWENCCKFMILRVYAALLTNGQTEVKLDPNTQYCE